MNIFKRRNPTKFSESLEKTRGSLLAQLGDLFKNPELNVEFWENLEDTLISADTGVETSEKIVTQLKENAKIKTISSGEECLKELRSELIKIFDLNDEDPFASVQKPAVFVMVGVNGAGKTTSIAKLTHLLTSLNQKVILGAADTFRAAAVDQIQIWGEKLGVTVIAQDPGADPGAVAYDTITAAKNRNMDVAIIDTAGRLQDKSNLMEELKKI